jgi:hypothetical protein
MWLMGYDCCAPGFLNPMNLDFSTGSLVIAEVTRKMNFSETIGEMCNSSGVVLFYSNGAYISTALDDTMQNGSGLNPSFFTRNHFRLGLTLPQGNLVIPDPGDSSRYYLFHETIDDPDSYCSLHFYYSIIDLSFNNGLGLVTQKNVSLINDSLIPGRITACKHANGRDWWIVCPGFHSGNIYKFLLTPTGLQGPFIQDLVTWRDIGYGQVVFNPQGTKFAQYNPYEDLDIWDFDRCTGVFSNQIHIDINDSGAGGGAAFSPSGNILYVSSTNYVYQYNLLASNVDSSRVTIGVWDGTFSPYSPFAANFYLAQLATDNKIYINCTNSTMTLHVINNPDSLGLACDFCQHCVSLPDFNAFTIPNFPNYYLGAEGNSVCDSLPTSIALISSPSSNFDVFPNPASRLVYVSNANNSKIEKLHIYNTMGQLMDCRMAPVKNNSYIEIDVSGLLSGVYYLVIEMSGERVVKKVVRE